MKENQTKLIIEETLFLILILGHGLITPLLFNDINSLIHPIVVTIGLILHFKIKQKNKKFALINYSLISMFTVTLGVLGIYEYAHEVDGAVFSPSEILYRSILLFTGETGSVDSAIPFKFDYARWLALASIGYALSSLVFIGVSKKFDQLRCLFKRNHYIVFGHTTWAFSWIQTLIDEKKIAPGQIIWIGNENLSNLSELQDLGVIVIHDEISHYISHPGSIQLDKSLCFLAMTDNAFYNHEIIENITNQNLDYKNRVKAGVLVDSIELKLAFSVHDLYQEKKIDKPEVFLIDINTNSARELINRFGPERLIAINNPLEFSPHIVIFGKSHFFHSVIIQSLFNFHFISKKKIRLTLICPVDELFPEKIKENFPGVIEFFDLNVIRTKEDIPTLLEIKSLTDNKPDLIYFCHPQEVVQLVSFERITNHLAQTNLKVVICDDGEKCESFWNSKKYLENIRPKPYIFNIRLGGVVSDPLLSENIDKYAMACHEYYRNEYKTLLPWEQLAEYLRVSNRALADHLSVKLALLGYEIDPNGDCPKIEIPENLIETMAEMEHQRWNAERWLSGWSFGPRDVKNNDPFLKHHNLVGWDLLDNDSKGKDRGFIIKIEEFLKQTEIKYSRIR